LLCAELFDLHMIKGQMYGRAELDPLRKRVIAGP
jgi:hypothetical protein